MITSCSNGKEKTYVGSTPADNVVRSFLGISLSDSVDFIRWWVTIDGEKYNLKCNYGIGKPGTPGFWNGGNWMKLSGSITRNGNYYSFENNGGRLMVLQINPTLLHLVDENKNLLVGNGGFSYMLNNKTAPTDQLNVLSAQEQLSDSMTFQGRTLCSDFSINPPGANCAKMKWNIVLYTDAVSHNPTTYLLNRNRFDAGKKGTWKIITTKSGRIIYELAPEHGSISTHLLKLDDNILLFIDAKGNLLVGNEDFSFTLNRKR